MREGVWREGLWREERKESVYDSTDGSVCTVN